MQHNSGFLRLSEGFILIAMLQSWMLSFFILLMAVTKSAAVSETIIRPIMRVGNECRIETKNIHGCQVGWHEEKEWDVDNRPIAILESGKQLNCIEPCIKLMQHEIQLNCTSLKYILVKYTCRCIKDNKVNETVFRFRGIQELVPFPNLTAVTPESKTPKLEKHVHIGIGLFLGIAGLAVLAVFSIYLKRKCKRKRTRRETDNEAIG